MDITNEVYNAISRYYTILSKTGYKEYNEVDDLLIYTFIEELLTEYAEFITESDLQSITKLLYCLYGSCMILFPDYEDYVGVINTIQSQFRITENNCMRITEDNSFRTI